MATRKKVLFLFILLFFLFIGMQGEVRKVCYDRVYYDVYPDSAIVTGVMDITDDSEYNARSITIRANVEGVPVTTIGYSAFYLDSELNRLERINLPSSIRYIDYNAFYNQFTIKSINLPEGLKYIGGYAFWSCDDLQAIKIPMSVKYIGRNAFHGCESLNSFIVDPFNSVYFTKDNVLFDKNGGLVDFVKTKQKGSYTIPIGTACVREDAFLYCDIEKIIMPETIDSIGNGAFANCRNLSEINFPQSLRKIGETAFANCDFSDISLPEKLEYIGSTAFTDCKKISSIKIPDNVIYLGGLAFSDCINLESAILPSHITKIPAALFARCSKLQSIDLPEGVTTLESGVFMHCKSLKNLALPQTLEVFGTGIIPDMLWGCDNLSIIVCKSTTPPKCKRSAVSYVLENCVLKVPYQSKEAYETAEGWRDFKNIETFMTSDIENISRHEEIKEVISYNEKGIKVDNKSKGFVIKKISDGRVLKRYNR